MSNSLNTMDTMDKLTRVRSLVRALGCMNDPEASALSELAWTLEERIDDAMATLAAEQARQEGRVET